MALRQDGFGDALSLCKGCGSCSLCSQVGASIWDQSMAEEGDGVMAVSTVWGHSAARSPKDHSGSCLYSLPSASLPPHLQLLLCFGGGPMPKPSGKKAPFYFLPAKLSLSLPTSCHQHLSGSNAQQVFSLTTAFLEALCPAAHSLRGATLHCTGAAQHSTLSCSSVLHCCKGQSLQAWLWCWVSPWAFLLALQHAVRGRPLSSNSAGL